MNDGEARVESDVRTFGWHVVLVGSSNDRPGFAYTIGLFHRHHHPEVVVLGLPDGTAHEVLNVVGGAVSRGARFEAGVQTGEILQGLAVAFVELPTAAYPSYLGYARRFYGGDEFTALQLVWPDAAGRFPWDEGVAEHARVNQSVRP
jgi:hypothetical protein